MSLKLPYVSSSRFIIFSCRIGLFGDVSFSFVVFGFGWRRFFYSSFCNSSFNFSVVLTYSRSNARGDTCAYLLDNFLLFSLILLFLNSNFYLFKLIEFVLPVGLGTDLNLFFLLFSIIDKLSCIFLSFYLPLVTYCWLCLELINLSSI